MKKIYIVLSKTNTNFAKLTCKYLNCKYNHTSIALDEGLSSLYSFARKNYFIPADSGPVMENVARFTLNKSNFVNVKVYEIPVENWQFLKISEMINEIFSDKKYMYNLYSALSMPWLGGFRTEKAFTCCEFIAYMFKKVGIEIKKPYYKYVPEEFCKEFEDRLVYEGDIMEYPGLKLSLADNSKFFDFPGRFRYLRLSLGVLFILLFRKMFLIKRKAI